jgi:hypothetical protein
MGAKCRREGIGLSEITAIAPVQAKPVATPKMMINVILRYEAHFSIIVPR